MEIDSSKVYFIDTRGSGFFPTSKVWQDKVNNAIEEILREIPISWQEPLLIKCHIGEPKNVTRMIPEYCLSTLRYFKSLGLKRAVCGDTTVAYSGERGEKENPLNDPSRYLSLAKRHGWDIDGPLRIPYVVLDRPITSVPSIFEFTNVESVIKRPNPSVPFRKIFVAGGFIIAGTIVNHAHLTLHELSHLAGAVKGMAMGCASYNGKLLIHQFYLPDINIDTCISCGVCSKDCPEGALEWQDGRPPYLIEERCIGCGECVALCPSGSIEMRAREPSNWMRAEGRISYRLIDFLIAMMDGRWERLLNILHLYNITRLCDCINRPQTPIFNHIGFLIGKNPFAVDLMARRLICEELKREGRGEGLDVFFKKDDKEGPYEYVSKVYGICVEPVCKTLRL